MSAGRFSHSRTVAPKVKDSGLFWWAVIITLLLGAAIASWFFSIYLFAYPEKPFNYRFLNRLHKLETITKFKLNDVPAGNFYSPKAAFQEFSRLTDDQLAKMSERLRRAYITNYKGADDKPVYLRGDFKIYQVRPLTEADVFQSGLVVRAQAFEKLEKSVEVFPNTLIEFVLPTSGPAQAAFNVNDVLTIDQKSIFAAADDAAGAGSRRSYASVLNIQKLPGEKLLFTTVPLLYGTYEINREQGARITLEPPAKLNMDGRWPLTDEAVGTTVNVAAFSNS
ncbi:MAG: hypothetical protein KA004_01245 [Verrucomicrobiales bacterium]|nr:hypothetical protein [Verrucomicrobiales bacterium]